MDHLLPSAESTIDPCFGVYTVQEGLVISSIMGRRERRKDYVSHFVYIRVWMEAQVVQHVEYCSYL